MTRFKQKSPCALGLHSLGLGLALIDSMEQ